MSQKQVQQIFKETDTHIYGFFGDYRFLSNFHNCWVVYEDLRYPSSEAAYQAAKLSVPGDLEETNNRRRKFTEMSPAMAKKEGRMLALRPNWETPLPILSSQTEGILSCFKDTVMYEILCSKFIRNKDLKKKLKATGTKILEETNWWGDRYWGVCLGKGENKLGRILMLVRQEL